MADDWRQHVINNVLPRMEANAAPAATSFDPAPATPQPFSVAAHLQPSFDPLERLAHLPASADRMRAVVQRSVDKHLLIPPGEDVRQASMRKIEAKNLVEQLQAHPQNFGKSLKPDHPLVIEATKAFEKASADFERLRALQEVRTAAWQSASQAKAACENWLGRGVPGNCKLEAVEVEQPKLNRGEDVLSGIERLRRRVRELKADAHRIRSSPFPSAYCKQRMRAQVEALAQAGAPSVSALIELDGKIEFQTQRLTSEVHAERRSLAFTETADAVALTCWLHKDALIAALDREIASEADDAASLSHETRQKAEAETMSDLLAVERDEAALTWSAMEQSLPVEFRPDISPLAILQLRLITTPRSDGLPPSSPERSSYIIGGGR